jgi:hypothetical protein
VVQLIAGVGVVRTFRIAPLSELLPKFVQCPIKVGPVCAEANYESTVRATFREPCSTVISRNGAHLAGSERARFRILLPAPSNVLNVVVPSAPSCTTARSFSFVSFKRKNALPAFVPISIPVLSLATSGAYSIRMPANPVLSSKRQPKRLDPGDLV